MSDDEAVVAAEVAGLDHELRALDESDPSTWPGLDERALAILAAYAHQAIDQHPPGRRETLRAAWAAGETRLVFTEFGPSGQRSPHVIVRVMGRPIVVAELAELLPLDDLL